MLRITEHFENATTVRLRLDGTLARESFDALTQVVTQHRAHAEQTILLDMGGVDFMNDQAARQLIQMSGDRCRLINCSPFIATLLGTITSGDGV